MFPYDSSHRWFTLCRKPNKTLIHEIGKRKKMKQNSSESGNILIPIQNSQAHWKCVAAVGSSIYAIGEEAACCSRNYNIGKGEEAYSSSVSILDCWTHTWRDGPSMRVKRKFPSANVVDGKIYVAGGCKDYKSSDWMEVFDPKTQAWEIVTSTLAQRRITNVYESGVIDGEIYLFENHQGVIYKPKDNSWEATHGFLLRSCCIIGNVLYGYCFWIGIQWYDFTIGSWNNLKGDVCFLGLPKTSGSLVRLVDSGEKMAVLWDEYPPLDFRTSVQYEEEMTRQNRVLWCGVIKLRKVNCDEIWGEVEWVDPVLTVPKSYVIEHALSATV